MITHRTDLAGHKDKITSIKISDDNNFIFTISRDKKLIIWSFDNQSYAKPIKCLNDANGFVTSLCIKYPFILTGSADKYARLYNLEDLNKKPILLKGHKKEINCVAINKSANKFATGSDDGTLCIWNYQGELIYQFQNNNAAWITCAEFLDDKIVTGDFNGFVKVWDQGEIVSEFYHTPEETKKLDFFDKETTRNKLPISQGITCMAITPDGAYFAYATRDSTVYFVEFSSKKLIRSFQTESIVYSCAFALTEQVLALATEKQIILWDVIANKTTCKYIDFDQVRVASIAWNRNNLLVGLSDGRIRVLEYNSTMELNEE